MAKQDWKVGQAVVVADQRNRDVALLDRTITKIGRTWITVGEGWQEERFDFDGRGDRNFGHRPTLWASREAVRGAHISAAPMGCLGGVGPSAPSAARAHFDRANQRDDCRSGATP